MNQLQLLADRYGIEASFLDARGQLMHTAPATRQALLAAMGVDASSEDAAAAALTGLVQHEWLSPLAPAHVLRASEGLSVPVTYPAGTGRIRWQLHLESGQTRAGETEFASLTLGEQCELTSSKIERRALPLGTQIPWGYHRLTVMPGEGESLLIISPGQCWLPTALEQGRRLWGVAVQLYLLKSASNWGIGDFTDLARLAQTLSRCGAEAIGLNPLHAMFTDDPEHASPYSPASRLLLNVLYIDVKAVAEATSCAAALETLEGEEFQRELRASRAATLVDYTRVTHLKLSLLKTVFTAVRGMRESSHWQAFQSFRGRQSATFERHCLFLALREHFATATPQAADWRRWPREFQGPESAAVERFAQDRHEAVDFQAWLQFLADTQLGEAARSAAPMAVGLYRDLAVGADPAGAETWSNQHSVITAAQVGAPPDIYNPAGQDWGLPPFHPQALKQEGYRSFIELVRANMRHAGGLRIDHVMALQQLYWVPQGASAAEGAYVRYPREDLIGILALESHRNQCLVVGEDLGTVPAGFRERMAEARILSYRVLLFEKAEPGFVPPERYPRLSLAVAGSHDLPTLRAWLLGSDLTLKEQLGLFPNATLFKDAQRERVHDREDLLEAFAGQRLAAHPEMPTSTFVDAAHRYLARTASALAMVQIDDVTEEIAPVNVPATSTEHPNWRRRLSMSVEEIGTDSRLQRVAASMNEARSGQPAPGSNSA